jgi:competence protein ComEA
MNPQEKVDVSDQTLVDVNTASADELDAVPGLAGHGFEIVRYRGERGRFTDLRQLDEVPGLAGKADDGRASLTVGDA